MADNDSESDEEVDILSSVDEGRGSVMFGEHFTNHFPPSAISLGHIGSLHGSTGISFPDQQHVARQESESGSEGSGSSQSDSESDDNDNGQPVQMQQRYQVPRLSHFNPAPSMQMSSPPGYPQHSFNNNPTTPTKKNKFDERFWEEDPETYGVRRSGRSRKEPERFNVIQEGSDSEDGEKPTGGIQRKKKKVVKGRQARRISSASEDWSAVDGHESESDSSDNYTPEHEVRNRPRPVPRPNARVPPVVPKQKDPAPRKKTLAPSPQKTPSRVKKLESEESDDDDESDEDDDEDDENSRNSVRRAAVNISSYKEDSEDATDSDELIEQNQDAAGEYVEDDRECIERVLYSRMGRPGEVGAVTTIYAPDYEEMMKRGEPLPGEPSEVQYLIKWKGWSHLHNTWETEKGLTEQNVKGMKKLSNLMKREEDIATWKKFALPEDIEYFNIQLQMNYDLYDEYKEVERIIAHTMVKNLDLEGNTVSQVDYLCKWQGLPYSESTWEDGGLTSRFYQQKIDAYLNRQRSEKIPSRSAKVHRQRPKFVPIKKQPSFLGGAELKLRDYQLDGLNWLVNSWCRGHSVILADEMGLGKTIQVISFLSYLYNAQSLYGPFLLVVPLSTMAAWQREFGLWGEEMNIVVYLGDVTSRNKIREFEWYRSNSKSLKFNALLTTYEILLKDKATLGTINWCCLVVDEAHRLKNDDSLLYKALMDFNTNHRVLITGTPLQNSLKELWALLHFIMPERFYSWDEFDRQHATQEQKDKGFSTLHKELEPFLLRRVKKDVEKSLPAKVEQILRVEMSSIQKQYYRWILTKNFAALNKGLKGNLNSFLNIVMELKKCCNHAQLIRPDNYQLTTDPLQTLIRGSGKLFLLDKLLCRLKETGHRVLIFSQMVRMLDILAEYLQLRRFLFQRLDGSIRGDLRKQALDHFNAEGSEDFCFLLSTRAGGLGINLATADTVIIFDSDWNPQNDLQAQARAHRIGQRNQVNIYRFVSKGSIEEDILERAKRKMVLDHLIIQRMDTTGRKVLSKASSSSSSNPFNKDELAAILKFGAEELFKEGDGEDTQLQEMDIDDILRAAETRDSDDHPHTIGEELLSQFKVASITLDADEDEVAVVNQENKPLNEEKAWSDIIPESERRKLEEEEEQKKQLELYLPKRNRKTVKKMNYGKPANSDSEQEGRSKKARGRKKKSESESDDDSGGEGKETKRKRGRPRTIKREDVEGFNDAEIRRFVKSYKKFGRPRTRLESIATDAELDDKSSEDLTRLADILHNSCIKAVAEYEDKLKEDPNFDGKKRGATVRLSNVTVNAPSVLKHEEELESLAAIMPADFDERRKFRLMAPAKSVHWGVTWDVPDDSMLLVGIFEYGLGSWEAIKADESLSLTSKILPPGNLKPQDKHLQTRVEYLIKLLKQAAVEDKAEQLRKSSQMIKSKIRQLKRKETKKGKSHSDVESLSNSAAPSPMGVVSPPDHSAETKDDGVTADVNQEGQVPPEGKKKRKMTKKKENGKVEGEKPKRQKKEKKEVPKDKKQDVKEVAVDHEEPPSPLKTAEEAGKPQGSYALADMDKTTFDECKEKMRPVKRALKMLESPEGNTKEEDQVQQTRQCLLKIGDHIMDATSHHKDDDTKALWRNNLWTFVSKFTSFEAKKLFKLYKHAAKKREETKAQERAQHKPATQMQRPPQDAKKHPGDHAHQRSGDLKRPTDGGGPGGKIPRMDRTYSGSSSHSGGRPSGSGDSYDPRRSSSFSHSDRTGTSSKERSRDGSDYSHRYHDSYRDRPSFHNSDFSRTHERSSDHGRSHDQHSRGYERSSDHSRSYEKRDRRDDYHRGSSRDYLSEGRYHHSHRERNSDSTLRHGNSVTSPKSGSTHESKRYEEKRSVEGERDKR